VKKLGIDLKETDFLFGRPLVATVSMYGLKVERQADGSFFLTIADSARVENRKGQDG
jgi:hypothetical protein